VDRPTCGSVRAPRAPQAGGSWLPSTVIASDGGIAPSLAVRADGDAFVAWQDGYCSASCPRVWGAGYDLGSGTWSVAERIDTNGSGLCAAAPSAALDAGHTIVVWKNSLNLPSGENDDDIYARVDPSAP
jgi:hypothetical protein